MSRAAASSRVWFYVIVLALASGLLVGLASAQGDPQVHVVERGDTLEEIAEQYGVTVQALAEANAIADPNRIYPGQELIIPGGDGSGGGGASTAGAGATPTPRPASGTTYVVQRRDTLDTIGQGLNVDPAAIIVANPGLEANPGLIIPGQVLTIPDNPPPYPYPVPGLGWLLPAEGQGGGGGRGADESYTVQRGDVLDVIAQRFDVALESILYANDIAWPYRLFPGQVLTIPGDAPPYGVVPPLPDQGGGGLTAGGVSGAVETTGTEEGAAPPAEGTGGGGTAYTVQEGDTLLSIAAEQGVDPVDIVRVNPGLISGIALSPGTVLVIP